VFVETVPAGVRLAIDHHEGLSFGPGYLVDGHEVDVEQVDHGPVFGPADEAVAGQACALAEAGFHEERQPHHAAQAIRVGVDVRDKRDPGGIFQTCQEPIGTAQSCRLAVHGLGALARHKSRPSKGE
jgi:hypothetical protein